MKIRLGEDGDIDALLSLRQQSIKDLCAKSYTQEQLKAWAEKSVDTASIERDLDRGNVFVVVEKGAVQGYIHIRSSPRPGNNSSAYVESLFVSASIANQGCGSKLLKKAEELAKQRSIAQMKVTISKNAADFFDKHGYEVLGPNLRRTIGDQVLEFRPLTKKIVLAEKAVKAVKAVKK